MATGPLQSYSDAIDYLYGYVNWEIERHVRNAPEVMTLERPAGCWLRLISRTSVTRLFTLRGPRARGRWGPCARRRCARPAYGPGYIRHLICKISASGFVLMTN